jgi:hypothetical protein
MDLLTLIVILSEAKNLPVQYMRPFTESSLRYFTSFSMTTLEGRRTGNFELGIA